jgi:hypothetical protein
MKTNPVKKTFRLHYWTVDTLDCHYFIIMQYMREELLNTKFIKQNKETLWLLVHKQTTLIEQPLPVNEVSANFCS